MGTEWGRTEPGSSRLAALSEPAGDNLRTSRGQPGDSVRTTGGENFVVLRRALPVHLVCTLAVDRNSTSDLHKRPLSTLSTAPMTMTALSLSTRKNLKPSK